MGRLRRLLRHREERLSHQPLGQMVTGHASATPYVLISPPIFHNATKNNILGLHPRIRARRGQEPGAVEGRVPVTNT